MKLRDILFLLLFADFTYRLNEGDNDHSTYFYIIKCLMNLIEIFLIELKYYKVWHCNVTKAHFEGVKDLILFF